MQQLFIIITIIFFLGCKSVVSSNKNIQANIIDNSTNNSTPMLLGHCSIQLLQQPPFANWFVPNYIAYQPNSQIIQAIQTATTNKKYRFQIFLGTWCGDSKKEVPTMLKTLLQAGIDTSQIQLIMVSNNANTYKQSPQHQEDGKYIFRVPTCIVYKNNKYIGRLIESPITSTEADLLAIIKQKPYTPNYAAAHIATQTIAVKNTPLQQQKLAAISKQIQPFANNAFQLNSLAYLLQTQKKYYAAINILTINRQLFSTNQQLYEALINNYTAINQTAKAIETAKHVLTIYPNNMLAKNLLSNINTP